MIDREVLTMRSYPTRTVVLRMIKDFAQSVSGVRLAIVFGSFLRRWENSDIDFKIFTDSTIGEAEILEAADFARLLHRRFAPSRAEPGSGDVPFEYKVLLDSSLIDRALSLEAFRAKAGGLIIPLIPRDPEYLRSTHCQLRTVLGALASPHLRLVGDPGLHHTRRREAFEAVCRLVRQVHSVDSEDRELLLERILRTPDGPCGKAYLGYADDAFTRQWIRRQLELQFGS